MNKANIIRFAALLLLTLLILLFASRYAGLPAVPNFLFPAAPRAAVKAGTTAAEKIPHAVRKNNGPAKPAGRREKRVSTLREPGEALIGGK
jgi:hypothetical protein